MRFGKKDEEEQALHSTRGARHLAVKKSSLDELMQFARGGMGHELKQSMHPPPEGSPEEELHESPGEEAHEPHGHEDIPGVNEDPEDLEPRHATGPAPGDTSRTVPHAKPQHGHDELKAMLLQMKAGKRRG